MFDKVSVEDVRKYWNDRPCNVRHGTAEVGTKTYFEQVEARKYLVEPHIPGFADFELWRGKKVLEIGCGIGTDTINFAKAGAKVTAIDLSDESLALAKKRAEVFGLDIKFYQGDSEVLSTIVPVEDYDLIYSFGVIHHTPHPERVLSEIQEYMHYKSALKIMVYNKFSWKVLGIIFKNLFSGAWNLDKWIAKYSEAQTGCPVTYSYTKSSVKNLLKDFEVVDSFVDHIFPYSIPEYKKYEYKKVWYFRMLPEEMFRNLEKILGWHLCVTARLK